jgi:uncharacterized YigZ family protein
MRSILGLEKNELVEKKSRFIALLYHVETIDEVSKILEKVRKDYPNANHYTYAYILDEYHQKASDDGEPTRTAGYPILEVLKNNELNDCLLIVIRYFGGTLLGSGGLIRAYSKSASQVVSQAILTKKTTTFTCKVTCGYDFLGSLDKIIRENTDLIEVKYDQEVEFYFQIRQDKFPVIKSEIFNNNNYQDRLDIIEETENYSRIDY